MVVLFYFPNPGRQELNDLNAHQRFWRPLCYQLHQAPTYLLLLLGRMFLWHMRLNMLILWTVNVVVMSRYKSATLCLCHNSEVDYLITVSVHEISPFEFSMLLAYFLKYNDIFLFHHCSDD